jgi:diguanylate cyclase (GGDEF)-like protein
VTSTPSVPPERLHRATGDAAVPGQRGGTAEIAGMTVVAELGRGAHTVVYRVRRGGAEYALKLLDEPAGDGGEQLAGFRREAALMASIDHPALPRVHEVGEAAGRPYLVMDIISGQPLADLLAGGPLAQHRAVAIAEDLAGALADVHRIGLVHRDIKPQNIIVTETGDARLIDFGLAVRGRGADGERSSGIGDDTAVGTPAYTAPEQSGMLKRTVDRRADLYSLGVVLFQCLTGELPFPADDVGELLRQHAATPAPDPRDLVPDVSEPLAQVVAVLLAKDPDDRYAGAEDLVADLHRATRSTGPFRPTRVDVTVQHLTDVPLCGRDVEFARLADAWGRASDGTGGVTLVRGVPGVGKTRLALEIAAHARGQGALVLHGAAAADDPVPLAPLRAAVDGHLRAVASLPEPERLAALERLTTAAGPAADLLGSLSPALAVALGAQPLGTEDRREQFATAVSGFLVGLARDYGGLLLLLDDVQWLDAATRRVVQQLAVDIETAPVLVVATARGDGAALGTPAGADLLLGPLAEDGVRALVSAHLPGIDRGSELARLLTVRGNGNPFVVQEYLHAVVEAGLLRPAWGTWLLDTDGLDAIELPQDAFSLVLARIGDLGDHARRVLAAAATVGVRFHPEVVAEVCGLVTGPVLDVVSEAATRRMIEVRDGGTYAFVHERIREALVADLEPAALAALHGRIADALDAADAHVYAVAHHYLQAGPEADPPRAAAACALAGATALADHAPGQAVVFFEHAVSAGHPRYPEFLHTFGTALARAGRYTDAIARLREAIRPETPRLLQAAVLATIADASRATWDTEGARAAVAEGLAVLGHRMPRSRLLLVLTTLAHLLAGTFVRTTRIGAGTASGERRRRYELEAAFHTVGAYIGTLSMRPDVHIAHNLRSTFVVERLGRGAVYTRCTAARAFVFALLRLRRASARTFERAELGAAEVGDPLTTAMVAWYRGCAAYMAGHDSGETWMRAIEEHGRWVDVGQFCDAIATIAWEAAVLGRTAEAVAWYERGARRLEAAGSAERTAILSVGAVTQTMLGRPCAAAEELRKTEESLARHGGAGLRVNFVLSQLHALIEQGELGEPFEEVVAAFRALGLNPALMIRQHRPFFAHHAFGRLAQCRAARGEQRPIRLAAARDAVEMLERVAGTPALTVAAKIARADLTVLEGRPERALELTGAITPLRPDAPLLVFEAARTRARACLAVGLREEAERLATYAQGIAAAEGWPNRLRWLSSEFGVDGGTPAATRTRGLATSRGVATVGIERLRLDALEEVGRASAKVLDPRLLARKVLDTTIRLLTADRAALFLLPDGERGQLSLFVGRDAAGHDIADLTGYSTSVVEQVRITGEPQVLTGTEEGEAMGARSVVRHGLRSIMAAPLKLEGRLLGVVYLDSQVAKGVFTPDDAGLLTALTTSIATSLETARAAQLEVSVAAARRQRDVAEALSSAFTGMSATLEPDQVLSELVRAAGRVLPAARSWLVPPDASTPPRPVTGVGSRGAPATVAPDIPRGWSWLAVPLRSRETSLGTLVLCTADADAYREPEIEVAAALVAQGMTAYDNASLFAQVRELSVVDPLTGLANRRRFFEVAERDLLLAARQKRPAAALMIDIDRFKRINDTHGHPVGDEVIAAVAARLAGVLRESDVIGRYGGEEFCLLLPDLGAGEGGEPDVDAIGDEFGERLRAVVAAAPVETSAGPVRVTISVGVATSNPSDRHLGALLQRADKALYRAKQEGRNRVCRG